MPEDYRKLWNKFRQWIVDYEISKRTIHTDNYKRPERYCIALSTDELLEKMKEMEKNMAKSSQKSGQNDEKNGQKSGHEFFEENEN